jgi:hypothetical protein
MGSHFEAIFSPSSKPLEEVVRSSAHILGEAGFGFQNLVWKLQPVSGNPQLEGFEPVRVAGIEEVAERTRKWWGGSLEWFSSEIGETFLRIFSAGRDRHHIVYNESRRAHRMREKEPVLQQSLIAMLLRMTDAFGSDICTYKGESIDDFRSPTVVDLEDAIRLRDRWDGEVLIISENGVGPELKEEVEKLGPLVKKTTSGRYVLNYFGSRKAAVP